jgi:hypothetical protein
MYVCVHDCMHKVLCQNLCAQAIYHFPIEHNNNFGKFLLSYPTTPTPLMGLVLDRTLHC